MIIKTCGDGLSSSLNSGERGIISVDREPLRFRALADHREIVDCIYRCARGMDRHDAELIASAYHEDAIDDHGGFRGHRAEFIEYVNAPDGVHERLFVGHQHFIMNCLVEIDGDVAHVESYYQLIGQLRDAPGSMFSWGRYIDRFERRDEKWAIALRRVILEGSTQVGGLMDVTKGVFDSFPQSMWNRTDISYERPLSIA